MSQKVLIVEDEELLLEALEKKFTLELFQVMAAKNGEAGLSLALLKHPDIILLDIVMPVMDGMTMLEKLRADSWGKTVPVILLTNLSDSDKIVEAKKNGVYDYLIKADWRIDDVVKKVRSRLGA